MGMEKQKQNIKPNLALSMINGLGAQKITRLIRHFKEPEKIFESSPNELTRIDGIGIGIAKQILSFKDWDRVDKILKYAEKSDVWLLTQTDEEYPERLRHIYDPPILLWGRGNKNALSRDGIAIIGTRKPSAYGRDSAERFTKELVNNGLSIFSGLAYGIDTIAHRTTVEQKGTTVAVLGSGIDWIYPDANRKLAERIIENNGAIVTEFVPGTKPDAGNFPVRNRIVSGLSLGVLVVESADTGGSMITVGAALDQGREVFVIPHNLNNTAGAGCNSIIKRGHGKLVQNLQDILSELSVNVQQENKVQHQPKWKQIELSTEEYALCEAIGKETIHIDTLAEKTGIPGHSILVSLLQLELKGCVKALAGKHFQLV